MSSHNPVLFLDLEETLIDPIEDNNWRTTRFIPSNVEKIKEFIAKTNPQFIQIFSFAIWDKSDSWAYNMHLHERIQDKLGISIQANPPTSENIIDVCAKTLGIGSSKISRRDLSLLFGKQLTFALYAKGLFDLSDSDITLIDDMVYEEHIDLPTQKLSINFYNINEL